MHVSANFLLVLTFCEVITQKRVLFLDKTTLRPSKSLGHPVEEAVD